MKHLYLIFSFLLAVGMIGCKDDDEPGTNKKKFNPNASIKVTGQKKLQQRSVEPGTMGYEDSIKFIVKYAWKWEFQVKNSVWWEDGRQEAGIGALEGRDTINSKFIWSGIRVVYIKDLTPEKDTIYALGPFVAEATNFILLMAKKENGIPYVPDPAMDGYETFSLDYPADTVGYIPNAVILKARELITEAFNRGDYNRCYELFDSAYVFLPITGEGYRKLEAKGEN